MYKAIQEIGGYKIGEEVPKDKAEAWLKMYKVAPVEEVEGESSLPAKEEKKEEPKEENSEDSMIDDYLARNKNVVVKNIEEDDLSSEKLEKLLELEKEDKKRKQVIKAIEKKLKEREE